MCNKPPRLLSEERRREILELLEERGRVTVDGLADSFRVSAVTIRSDLDELGAKGLLVRSHGGAILPLSPKQEYPLQLKKVPASRGEGAYRPRRSSADAAAPDSNHRWWNDHCRSGPGPQANQSGSTDRDHARSEHRPRISRFS